MKLSDAAVMGSTVTTLCIASWAQCFLAAAAKAVGIREYVVGSEETASRLVRDIKDYWPWLEDIANHDTSGFRTYMGKIIETFDGGAPFDEVVAYVKSVEPACGECNRFACTCAKPAALEVCEVVAYA